MGPHTLVMDFPKIMKSSDAYKPLSSPGLRSRSRSESTILKGVGVGNFEREESESELLKSGRLRRIDYSTPCLHQHFSKNTASGGSFLIANRSGFIEYL